MVRIGDARAARIEHQRDGHGFADFAEGRDHFPLRAGEIVEGIDENVGLGQRPASADRRQHFGQPAVGIDPILTEKSHVMRIDQCQVVNLGLEG